MSTLSPPDRCRRGREHREFPALVCLSALRPSLVRRTETSALAPVTPDRSRTRSQRVLLGGFGDVPRFPFVRALARHKDLAGFEDLHLPAGAGPRVVAEFAGLHASG